MSEFDFVVMGGGSAGYAAARTAASEGLRVAILDSSEELGGLCILRGCMPSKTLIESANRMADIREAEEFGIQVGEVSVDIEKIIARKRRLISDFAKYRKEQLESGKFELVRGHGSFISPHEIHVQLRDGRECRLHARAVLVATGSVVRHPDIPGLDAVSPMTSDDVLDNTRLPKSLLVLGAGPVALELAYYHAALGCEVTVIQRSPQILSSMDGDIARAVQQGMEKAGIKFVTGCKILSAGHGSDGKCVHVVYEGHEETFVAEEILLALGRDPATDGLGLDAAGFDIPTGGALNVEDTQQTSVPHIFAAGDVTGKLEVVHIAIEQAEIGARNAARFLRGDEAKFETMDYRLALFAVFTEPEAAMVGLSEREASTLGIDAAVATYSFDDHGKSMVMGRTCGFVKLLAERATGELIGGAIVGPHASELIHEIVVAMRYRATASEFLKIPHYHPTLSEIWTYPAEALAEE